MLSLFRKRTPRAPRPRAMIDAFAEHLANDLSVKEAARLMQVSEQTGYNVLRQIKAELGVQAR